MEPSVKVRKARFRPFRADLRSGQLQKHGICLKLQDQPFQVLALLLERPGDLVTREELRQKLGLGTPSLTSTLVLTTPSRNCAMRWAIQPNKPRYIETYLAAVTV